jgi:hypothetical protein
VNRYTTRKKIESVIKNFLTKKIQRPDDFTGEFTKYLKMNINTSQNLQKV